MAVRVRPSAPVFMDKPEQVPHKKPYSRPQVIKRDREQVALMLLGHAWAGDKHAKELLEFAAEILFPPPQKAKV